MVPCSVPILLRHTPVSGILREEEMLPTLSRQEPMIQLGIQVPVRSRSNLPLIRKLSKSSWKSMLKRAALLLKHALRRQKKNFCGLFWRILNRCYCQKDRSEEQSRWKQNSFAGLENQSPG